MLNRSQSYDVASTSAAQLRFKRERREGRVEWGVDSSGDEDTIDQRPLRLSYVRRPPSRKISVLSSVNPSPRVSMFEGPNVSMLDTPLEEKQEDNNDLALRKEGTARVLAALLVIIATVQLVIIIYLVTRTGGNNMCTTTETDFIIPRDLQNPGIFDDLTPDELDSVNKYMLQNKELNLVPWSEAIINSSYIYMIELFLPNKSEALDFLDRGFIKPTREAKVVIFRGNSIPPRVDEYIVSPLPRPDTIRLYRDPSYRRYPIPYSSRQYDHVQMKAGNRLLMTLTEQLYPVLMESYGLCYHNCTRGVNCLHVSDIATRGYNSGDRRSWVWFFPDIEGYYNYPLGLQILIIHESVDEKKWSVEKLVYNGQDFDSIDSLLTAFVSGRVKKIHYRILSRDRDIQKKESFTGYQQHGPRLYEPEGKRFRISGQSVIYNNWKLTYNMQPSTGLRLFDVTFAGARIAYEISLQEILVFYTGYSPLQANSYYYDSASMVGGSSMELVRGVDCPDTAVMLDSYFWVNSGHTKRTKNNICVFERNSELPIHRHYTDNYNDGFDYYRGTPNYNLVIRTVASIWNYDYIIDYVFYNNGAFEAKVSLTGYVQSAFDLPEEQQYGNPINDFASANLHQHAFNFKVDLDIAGDLNRYSIHDIELENVTDPWRENVTRLQMQIDKKEVEFESCDVAEQFTDKQYHLFYNKNAENKYGTKRSYRIINKAPVAAILSDIDATKAASWIKYPIMVTRRKDSESCSSSMYAQGDPWNPVLDFDEFINDESLVDQDLVAWVTTGTYHIPGTEDIPLTSTVWNQYSFFLAPHNYFWRSPDAESTDTFRMVPNDTEALMLEGNTEYTCIPPRKIPFSYDGRRN